MGRKYTAVFFFLLTCVGGGLFYVTYRDAKDRAIDELKSRQLILAEKAEAEIENFFDTITSFLTELSASNHIIELDETGKEEMDFALKIRPEGITAITRVDASAKIIYTTPVNEDAIDKNIYYQEHIQKIFSTHKPVASDVFNAAQGYRAVAVHVPVFNGREFKGSLAVLVDFPSISKRYLQNIHLGETGHAWMISRDGIELYCPDPENIGKSVFETCKDSPSILSMVGKMLKGEEGATIYEVNNVGKEESETITNHAVFMPVTVVDGFWSIAVVSAEKEVLASLVKLRNQLMMVTGLLLAFSISFFYYSTKAWAIVRDEKRRKQAEKEIRELSQFRESVIENANVWLDVLDEKGNIVVWNEAAESISGYTKEEVVGHGKVWEWLYPDTTYREEIVAKAAAIIRENEVVTDFETRITRKDGEEKIISWHSRNFSGDAGEVVGSIALGRDITEQKFAEEALKESSRKYNQLVDDIGPAIMTFSYQPDGVLTYISPSIKKITGLEPADLIGKQWQSILKWEPKSLKLAAGENQKLIDGQKDNDYDMSFTDNDSVRTFHIRSHIVEDKHGAVGIEGTATDITNRKLAELEREKLIKELQTALKDVNTLSGLLPICSNCKKIRNDQGYWDDLESYLEKHSNISFSHSLCRECVAELYGGEEWFIKAQKGKK